jgi:Xanthomonas XOO_2897-like deaminase
VASLIDPRNVALLQRAAGNRATSALVQSELTPIRGTINRPSPRARRDGVKVGGQLQRDPPKTKVPPASKPPPPRLPEKIIVGSTELSRAAEAYRIDQGAGLPEGTNLLVVEYSTGSSNTRERKVIANRPGVAHSEPEMDQYLLELRRQAKAKITVHEIYSERQPCGPSDHDCELLLLRRYPTAKVTFGWNYQETETPGPESRAARAKARIQAQQVRLTASKQLEWVFEHEPPPHHERNEPGPISKKPRRWRGRIIKKEAVPETASASKSGGGGRKTPSPAQDPAEQETVHTVRPGGPPPTHFEPTGSELASQEAALAAGELVGMLLNLVIPNPFDAQNTADLEQGIAGLDNDVVAKQDALRSKALELQRGGEVACLNVVYAVEYFPGRYTRLHSVELDSVEVTSWFKEGRLKLHRPFNTQEALGNSWTEKIEVSWGLAVDPDLVEEAAKRLTTRLEQLENDMGVMTADAKNLGGLSAEHQELVRCLELLGRRARDIPYLDFLGGPCLGRLTSHK